MLGWKLCVRGSLRKVQKQPSVREQPVQRSWGGNDLVCSGKRRHLRVGLRNGDLGEDQGRSWPCRGPRFSHEWDAGPGGFGRIFLEDLLAFHGPQSSKKEEVEAKRPRPVTGRWEGMTGPLEGVGRQMAAAGVPQGRCSTGVRVPASSWGPLQVLLSWRLQPSPSSPTGDPDLVGPTGWTDRGVRIRGQADN